MVMKPLFYLFALLSGYSYFLYPLILRILPRRVPVAESAAETERLPTLSLIVTVHNEEARIRDKIENSLRIDYPQPLLEIIVASDCSVDATDHIVEEYAGSGVRLVRADERKGKEYAQLCAIRAARGEILVFSDAATVIPESALHILAGRFSDRRIGAVSSEDRFVSADGQVAGEGLYVRYEMWLRRLESDHAGLVGLSGSFFAARREVCGSWDIHAPSDFNTALNCASLGLVAISDPGVLGIYSDVQDPGLEFHRKVRTVIRGITALVRHPEALNPFRLGLFSFQVWSHKIMRWGVPWFLLGVLVLSLLLAEEGRVYQIALALQVIFYALAAAGWVSARMRENKLVRVIFFFVQTNLALAQAAAYFLAGRRMSTWTPSRR
jgi:glycosyltransferase involved in cell wall biosynthesis